MRDKIPVDAYDFDGGVRLHVTILSPEMLSCLTGQPPISSPVSVKTYVQAGLPWFDFYDEGTPMANNVSRSGHGLANVRSVQSVLGERRDANPERYACCYCSCTASYEVQPCGHLLCEECADGLMDNECPKRCRLVTGRKKVMSAAVAESEAGWMLPEAGTEDERVVKLSRYAKRGVVGTFKLPQNNTSRLCGGTV